MARKLVVVNDNVRLVELGNIYGPISTPTRIPLETIRTMCVKNRDVWECDPNDPRDREKRVKLTLSNYGETHFGVGEKKATENKPLGVAGMNMDSMDHFDPNPAPAETSEPKVPAADPTPDLTEEKKGIQDYSYIMGGVNMDAMDQYDPNPIPAGEKEDAAPAEDPIDDSAPVEESDAPENAEEAPVPESAEPETKEEAAPVVEEKAPANQQNSSQNHGGKKNKKGR